MTQINELSILIPVGSRNNRKSALFCADRFSQAQIVGTRNKEKTRNKGNTGNKE